MNQLLLSNNQAKAQSDKKNQIVFINYDYKNKLEEFSPKTSNPLVFPDKLIISAEKQILFDTFKQSSFAKQNSVKLIPLTSKEDYIKNVLSLKEHINKGNIYEINYCITFESFDANIDPLFTYEKLNNMSNASYAALAKFKHLYIISASPELFLSKVGNKLFSKPIKGTSRRGKSPEEDQRIREQLRASLKEQTENVMIVDVVRNDLSRFAKKGTVKVDKLFDIETYQQVHQMVSTVSCELKQDTSLEIIIDSTFPMASMTGAPKIKAMELIDEYETYNRGPYSGALGYRDEKGDVDLNVLIRSIFYDDQKKYLSFSVGSAITALCNPEEEYEECLLKAKALMETLNS